MPRSLPAIYDRLYAWCSSHDFAGFDPFDGLNSRVFQATPLKNYRLPRLILTQLVKRSPVNLRPLLLVEPGVNSKAIALFGLAELSRYRATNSDLHATRSRELLDRLLAMGIPDGDTLAFGYNFDWQSRVFFAPKGTPTIVPTAFASQAFHEAAIIFREARYSEAVEAVARSVATGLHRSIETDDEICFSYTPLDQSVILNASLLAAECLTRSVDKQHHDLARKALNFGVHRQQDDGSWFYGDGNSQSWVDNFHTAYVLQSIRRISHATGKTDGAEAAFKKGLRYWLTNFFLPDGTPKYFDSETYPIDIHSAGVAIAILAELSEIDLARKVADWTCRNMRDANGFFYYQAGHYTVSQTPFMRWGQAWMAYALARLMEAEVG